jgi:hypothetical protein
VSFSTRGVQKHDKKLFEENPCQNLLAKKVERKKLFCCRLFLSILFIAFLAVSLHEEPKNTIKIFSKIRLENLKKPPKKQVGGGFLFRLAKMEHPDNQSDSEKNRSAIQ